MLSVKLGGRDPHEGHVHPEFPRAVAGDKELLPPCCKKLREREATGRGFGGHEGVSASSPELASTLPAFQYKKL